MSDLNSNIGDVDETRRRDFERHRLAGMQCAIEDYLPFEADPHYLPTLRELVLIDLELRWKAWKEYRRSANADSAPMSAPPELEGYLERFPILRRAEMLRELEAEERRIKSFGEAGVGREELGASQPRAPMWHFGHDTNSGLTTGIPENCSVNHTVTNWGDYRIVREIGRGAMGVVYEAVQKSLSRRVALKVLPAKLAKDPRFREWLKLEAMAVAKVEHPNIVPIYDVGELDGQPYFSMKYVEGRTLAEEVRDAPMPSRAAAALLLPVCHAVAEAHRCGVMHRDLKPSNILIDLAGKPMVADFGLARVMSSGTLSHETNGIVGTPAYMAPEQAAGGREPLTLSCDIYGLGAILYHMLTGRPPFLAATVSETIAQVLAADPIPVDLLNPQVDFELTLIVRKCLQKSPAQRYGSVSELANDLKAYLKDQPIAARSRDFRELWAWVVRDTRYAPVLLEWGREWMFIGIFLFCFYFLTDVMRWLSEPSRWQLLGLWGGLALIHNFGMNWLRQGTGAITLAERQFAYISWAGTLISLQVFLLEWQLNLPLLQLAPVFSMVTGGQFLIMASLFSGRFYAQAMAYSICAVLMALFPGCSMTLLAFTALGAFFIPGWCMYRQRQKSPSSTPRSSASAT